jgi:hypothetical protein
VQRRCVGDADDDALGGLKPDYRPAPRFGACGVEEGDAALLQFRTGSLHRLGIYCLELRARLRDRPVGGPLISAEARLRGLAQGPDAEVLGSLDVLTVQLVVALGRPKRQPEGGDVERPTLPDAAGDHAALRARRRGRLVGDHVRHPGAVRGADHLLHPNPLQAQQDRRTD